MRVRGGWVVLGVLASSASLAQTNPHYPVIIAPAPAPTALPLLGPGGQDPDGYPKRYVDKVGLRSLFLHRRFKELTGYMEQFQDAFEKDPLDEFWPYDAARAFLSSDETQEPLFDAWIEQAPESFTPYLARAEYWMEVAGKRRGFKYASKTPASNFAGMETAHARAEKDFRKALSLRPRLQTPYQELMWIAANGSGDLSPLANEAEAVCPSCFLWRSTRMQSLQPKWGGSLEQMEAFARLSVQQSSNPRLKELAGFVDLERSQELSDQGDLAGARAAIARALQTGTYNRFLEQRALLEKAEPDKRLADLEAALALRPQELRVLAEVTRRLGDHAKWERAATLLLTALRLDPTDDAAYLRDTVIANLDKEALRMADKDRALALEDLGIQLRPDVSKNQFSIWEILAGEPTAQACLSGFFMAVSRTPPSNPIPNPLADRLLASAEPQARKKPGDRRAAQTLDIALRAHGQFDRGVEVWTRYLEHHPDSGLAYAERSEDEHWAGHAVQARDDAAKACDLGEGTGCWNQQSWPAPPPGP